MADPKNDQNTSNQNKGSGSDTASAAKISAGTSVGNPGATPMPHAAGSSGQGSAGQGSSKPGSSGQGASGGTSGASMPGSPQGSTPASHTPKPMGGQPGSTGQGGMGQGGMGQGGMGGSSGARGASAGMGGGQQHGSQGQPGGTTDQVKQTAEQVQEKASEALEQASDWARDTYERASSWASDAFEHGPDRPGRGRMGQRFGGAGRGVQQYVAQNPVMVGLVGLAAGLLIGALLPRTRREDEVFGEWADEVREQGMRYAQDMTQRGRDYVEQAFSGDDPRFSKHDSEFQGGSRDQGANRH